ncbi:glycoside hydrolase family 61 protein [Daldinia caldariorum]|uniref:glycoside hydrolase family 61 protein n=1 Tax=Daldinia caldariorum TaxID=326644 RepID=UPI002008BDA0|nr:glycoside hydrolase family 61 protein [Daldinia caldariorum]KAI1465365.1 glycoside hydrolase family 61 protein [Daldinia caldariorum]
MKAVAAILALVAAVEAHYTFPALIANGAATNKWEYVRKTTNYQSNGPVTDVSSEQLRCYQLAPGNEGAKTMTVAAGSTVGFTADGSVSHPGTLQFYMAKVPAGQTADSWDGSGAVWFKIFSQGPNISPSGLTWPSEGAKQVTTKIPSCIPAGDYLLRVEHIALHSAGSTGGAQLYISCGQLTVTGGGSKTPTNLVSFPGAYKATDPGLLINIYYPVPTSYTAPGPAVFTC